MLALSLIKSNDMKSIREIFRIGYGPSSSHTMGPRKAAEIFLAAHPDAARYQAHLYGSLSATGKGHLTDAAIIDVIPTVEIVWHEEFLPFHPNGMRFCAWDNQNNLLGDWTVYSVGGGALAEDPDGVRLLGDRAPQKSADFSGTPLAKGERQEVYHFDCYRIKDLREAMDMGTEEYLYSGNYCFIEWAEMIEPLLPEDTVWVKIEAMENGERRLSF